MSTARRRQRGVGLVEFSIAIPVLLLIVFGTVDFGRGIQANSTVADAARLAARQGAANASSGDSPFSAYNNGNCQGQTFTQNQSGATVGCLTDNGLLATAKSILAPLTSTVALAPAGSNSPSTCPTPAAGTAEVCIYPGESGTSPVYTNCAAATTALGSGHPVPTDALGTRKEEWGADHYQANSAGNTTGCFYIVVTVRYTLKAWTPGVSKFFGSGIVLSATTATLAEY